MCGIVYAHDLTGEAVNNAVLQQYDRQRLRGQQGFGLFDGQYKHIVRASQEDQILRWLCKYDSNLIMFHHRFPTSTINVKRAAHPFTTKDYFGKQQYILVHNGHITNASELLKQHTELGINYSSKLKDGTFNDSEALLWDFALYMEGRQPALKATGSIAFVCVKLDDRQLDRLYFGRNDNPLHLLRTKSSVGLSSEGEGKAIESDTLYSYNYAIDRLTSKKLDIPRYRGFTGIPLGKPWENDYSYPGEPRDWSSESLRTNLHHHLQAVKDRNEIEYEYDNAAQMYLPVGSSAEEMLRVEAEIEEEEREQMYFRCAPSPTEVEIEVAHFLIRHHGVFEQAYQEVEDEYLQLENDCEVEEEYKRMLLLEGVMQYIQYDPEFKSKKSVSSTWRVLWSQKNLN